MENGIVQIVRMIMTIKIIGVETIEPPRVITGYYSFDRAFPSVHDKNEIGVPVSAMELFGATHVGKSTSAYSLAGVVARHLQQDIAIADLETLDFRNVESSMNMVGFDGYVHMISAQTDEEYLDGLIDKLRDPHIGASILDSVGAISPITEQKGTHVEIVMGKRAQLMAKHYRKLLYILRQTPKLCIYTNHQNPRLTSYGGMYQPKSKHTGNTLPWHSVDSLNITN